MTKKKFPLLSYEQEVAQDVKEITEEVILAGVTGGAKLKPIEPYVRTILPAMERGNRATEALPFGLSVSRRPLLSTLNVSPTSAFRPYRPRIPDLNLPAKYEL